MQIRNLVMVITIAAFSVAGLAEQSSGKDTPAQTTTKSAPQINDNLDLKAWGIDKGCIRTMQIRSFRYFEPGVARIELTGGKKVLMRFANRCSGFRHNGVIYETRTGTLCEGFDSVRVLRQGSVCPIESIEPYLEPDNEPDSEPDNEPDSEPDIEPDVKPNVVNEEDKVSD